MDINEALATLELETPIKPKNEWSKHKQEAFHTIIQYFIENNDYQRVYNIKGNHYEKIKKIVLTNQNYNDIINT